MNKTLVAIAFSMSMAFAGCSSNSEMARVEVESRGDTKTLHSTRKVYAKNIIPRAASLGDDWMEIDKQIVSKSRVMRSGSGATADGNYVLLQSDTESIVTESPVVRTIARSVYSHYDVEEPVALSVTWVMNGRPIRGFEESDLYTLNRMHGLNDWLLEDKGIAVTMPTGDIYPGFKESMFAVNNPVAVYLAVDGGLVEVRASGELSPAEFSKAIDVVKDGLLRNIRPENEQSRQPENINIFWNVLKECML